MMDGSADRPGIAQERAPSGEAGVSLAGLGRISAELLHDLGGMLSVLEGRVALARSEAALGRSVSPELSQIQRDTRELRCMVRDILDELRAAPRSPEMAVQVSPLIEEAVDHWIPTGPRISASLDASLPSRAAIRGPRTFFTRTLGNLLRNAGRHAESRVRITVRALEGDTVLEAVVEDDGPGIDEGLREHIFDPLVAGEGGGLGLGLSFARWAAERLGGSVVLEASTDLGGAAFRLLVPLAETTETDRPTRSGKAAWVGDRPLLSGLRIAVVDDEASVAHMLRRRLEAEGAEALTPPVPMGDEIRPVLSALDEWDPDVLLLDLHLGLTSGLAVHEALTLRFPSLADRVLFLTGDAPPDPPPGPPVVHKLVEWDELVGQILEVAESADRTGG